MREKTYLKARDICVYVGEKYGLKYSVAGMTSWMKSHKFSFIKPHSVPAKADTSWQKQFIETYQSLKANTPAEEPIIFLDTVHPTMSTKETYSWIRKCTRKLIKSTAYKARMNHHLWTKSGNYACRNRRLQDRKLRIFDKFF